MLVNYLFDTNILVYIIKKHPAMAGLQANIDQEQDSLRIISIVTKAEIESLAMKLKWGNKRLQQLEALLNQFLIVPIDSNQIVRAYSEIDAFSQGKHPTLSLPGSSRNMGKNDLWIAATAFVTNATLITADGDFDHLNKKLLKVTKLKIISMKS
jgi:tRNA(fMet)-specific endonuclease VapC